MTLPAEFFDPWNALLVFVLMTVCVSRILRYVVARPANTEPRNNVRKIQANGSSLFLVAVSGSVYIFVSYSVDWDSSPS